MPDSSWSNLAKITYRRTYSRVKSNGKQEVWKDTVDRVIRGNLGLIKDSSEIWDNEGHLLEHFMLNRSAMPAGRGLWFSGTPAHAKLGAAASINCYFLTADSWQQYVIAQDLLMLGGGVGLSVENKYVSHLPLVKPSVRIVHTYTKDANLIIPDSREGWVDLTRRILKSYFESGQSFSYSTICLREAGEIIKGFGGKASGKAPLITFVEQLTALLNSRAGKKLRSIDAADILCIIAEMVVSGNVRRSAVMIQGDCFDKHILKAKRWDLGPLPRYRSQANFSVNCSDIEDLHPLFWESYEIGEAIGLINLHNIQHYGRMCDEPCYQELQGVNPCSEANLKNGEACNLQNIAMPRIRDVQEFRLAARLMYRYGKRIAARDTFHIPFIQNAVSAGQKIGTSLTGCLQSFLFNANDMSSAYQAIVQENREYSKLLGVPESDKLTTINPAGTLSKIMDVLPGGHAAYSRYMAQTIRFSSTDALVPLLRDAGHPIEQAVKLDGTLDPYTVVVYFYIDHGEDVPTTDTESTWDQLNTVIKLQEFWADQSVSTTVYYDKEDIPQIKEWLRTNLCRLKTVSFMQKTNHGFKQAPWQALSREEYETSSSKIREIKETAIYEGELDTQECAGGSCPIK